MNVSPMYIMTLAFPYQPPPPSIVPLKTDHKRAPLQTKLNVVFRVTYYLELRNVMSIYYTSYI